MNRQARDPFRARGLGLITAPGPSVRTPDSSPNVGGQYGGRGHFVNPYGGLAIAPSSVETALGDPVQLPAGLRETPRGPTGELHYQTVPFFVPVTGGEAVGTVLIARRSLGFMCRSVIVYNQSGHTIRFADFLAIVPPNAFGMSIMCRPAVPTLEVEIAAAGGSVGTITIICTDEELIPTGVKS